MVVAQVIAAYAVSSLSWPLIFLAAYVFGGTVNHSMSLAIHEISHNLAFGHSRPMANRFLGIFGNVIIGLPTWKAFCSATLSRRSSGFCYSHFSTHSVRCFS